MIAKYVYTALCLSLLLLFNFCSDIGGPVTGNPPCDGVDPLVVPEPPYNSPIWHPSGQFIGFNYVPLKSISYPFGEGCWGVQHFDYDSAGFWLIDPDGTDMRRIFPYRLMNPAWSPDGNWVAFTFPVGGEVHVFKMRFTGTGFDTTTIQQLTTEGRNFFPAWSPDGQWIAYDNTVCGGASDPPPPNSCGLLIVKAETERRFLAIGRMPDWTTDGASLIYVGSLREIFRVKVSDTSDVTRLTSFNQVDPYARDNRNPRYSPDGREIALWSNGDLWRIDSSGTNQEQLTSKGVDVSFGLPFTWSPDGSEIVYTSYRSDDWTYVNGVLWLINPITGEERQLTFNL